MTCKLSWITFIPFTLLAVASKIIQLFYLDENGLFMGLNSLTLSYVAIACSLIILLFGAVFCLIDKKTASVYMIKQNVPAGLFGLLLSVVLACDGANRAFNIFKSATYSFIEITDIVLTVLCAVVFVVLSLNHFVGNGGVKGISVFYLIPAMWSAFRLVKCFLDFTTISIMVADVTILACYIFSTLFLFNYAMIIALMKGKSPVRSAFIYGMPAVAILLSYGVYDIISNLRYASSTFSFFDSIEIFQLALLGLYFFAFIIEMSIFVKKNDEIEILDEDEDVEDVYEDVQDPDADIINALGNSVTKGNRPDEDVEGVVRYGFNSEHLAIDDEVFIEVAQASMNSFNNDENDMDMSSFIYGKAPSDDDYVLPVSSETESYEEEVVEEDDDDVFITEEDGTYFEEDEEKEIKSENIDERLDRIDKLILEITEDDLD